MELSKRQYPGRSIARSLKRAARAGWPCLAQNGVRAWGEGAIIKSNCRLDEREAPARWNCQISSAPAFIPVSIRRDRLDSDGPRSFGILKHAT